MTSAVKADRTCRIAVVGSAMVDLFAPRAGQRLADVTQLAFTAGGSATIISAAAARLGATVSLISAVGADELGSEWKRRAANLGIDVTSVVAVPEQLTPLSVSTIDLAGEKTYGFYRFPGYCDPLAALTATDELLELSAEVDVLVVTEAAIRGAPSREVIFQMLERRRARERNTIFSINYRPTSWTNEAEAREVLRSLASMVTIVCCNQAEYRLIHGDLSRALVFETAGSSGVRVHSGASTLQVDSPSVPGQILLDTGAGDTFCGAIAVAIAEGRGVEEAAVFACVAAGLAIRREGTSTAVPQRSEVDAVLHTLAAPT